jgi:hypothetical protein
LKKLVNRDKKTVSQQVICLRPGLGDMNVRKSQRVALHSVLLACLVVLPLAAGCADSEQRTANKNLVDAIERAQRLYDRGLALLANPVLKTGEKYLPINPGEDKTPVGQEPDVQIIPNAVNPKALDALKEAETCLTEAIRDNTAAAGAAEKALASLTLGRVTNAKAYLFTTVAAIHRGKAAGLVPAAEQSEWQTKTHLSLVNYHGQLAGVSSKDIQKVIDEATAQKQKAAAEAKDSKGKLEANATKKAQLLKSNQDRMEKARKIRVESRRITGQKSLDMLNQALEIEAAVNKDRRLVDAAEAETLALKVALADQELRLDSADQLLKAAEEILAGRKDATGKAKTELDAANAELAKILKTLEKVAGRIDAECTAAAAAETKAMAAFDAARALLVAGRAYPPHKAKVALADEADLLVERGKLSSARLGLQKRLTALVGKLTKAWPQMPGGAEAPAVVKKLQGYVPKPDDVKELAVKDLREAVDLYRRAVKSMKKEQQGMTHGSIAATYLLLYNLTGNSGDKSNAAEALGNAGSGSLIKDLRDIAK